MKRIGAAVFTFTLLFAGLTATSVPLTSSAQAQTKSYGCYKIINASTVRIRKKPYLWSKTIGYAQRGDKVVKNRRFCSVRITWCRVRHDDVSGWVGRKFLKKTAC